MRGVSTVSIGSVNFFQLAGATQPVRVGAPPVTLNTPTFLNAFQTNFLGAPDVPLLQGGQTPAISLATLDRKAAPFFLETASVLLCHAKRLEPHWPHGGRFELPSAPRWYVAKPPPFTRMDRTDLSLEYAGADEFSALRSIELGTEGDLTAEPKEVSLGLGLSGYSIVSGLDHDITTARQDFAVTAAGVRRVGVALEIGAATLLSLLGYPYGTPLSFAMMELAGAVAASSAFYNIDVGGFTFFHGPADRMNCKGHAAGHDGRRWVFPSGWDASWEDGELEVISGACMDSEPLIRIKIPAGLNSSTGVAVNIRFTEAMDGPFIHPLMEAARVWLARFEGFRSPNASAIARRYRPAPGIFAAQP